jgi:hypothetical protein
MDAARFVSEEVTIVLVTSFTGACPSTNLIEATVSSFSLVPALAQCRIVIVCDGFRTSNRRRTKAGRLVSIEGGSKTSRFERQRSARTALLIPRLIESRPFAASRRLGSLSGICAGSA